jgi:hypothetical protein
MATVAVIVDRWDLTPPQPLLAGVFEQQIQMPRPVAMKMANRARWIVWENTTADAAQRVCGAISAAGVPASVVPQTAVVPATNPRRVHVLKLDGDALGIQLKYTGPPAWVAWNDVLVVSAGAIRTETTTTEQTETYLPAGQKLVDTRVKIDISRAILAELYAHAAGGQNLLYIRLHCHEVNYAQTIGGSVQESWREKFSVVLARLGLRSTSSLISPQTESLLAAEMVPDEAKVNPYFADEEEFALYNRWLATRRLLGLGIG